MDSKSKILEQLEHLIETVHKLRAPGGCPWDQEQTHHSLRPYLVEECYELLDVLDQVKTDDALKSSEVREALVEELGDVLLQVLLHSEIASESKVFDLGQVAQGLRQKLIERHPHVFEDTRVNGSDEALKNWERQKAKAKAKKDPKASILDGVPQSAPALLKTHRLIEKVSRVGFQWDNLAEPLNKVEEEFSELKEALKHGQREKVENELGDLLFSVCNVAYLSKIQPEDALRGTLKKFERRFRHVENRLKEMGKTPGESNLKEMDLLWEEAKRNE